MHTLHEYLEEIEQSKVGAGLYTIGIPYAPGKQQSTGRSSIFPNNNRGLARLRNPQVCRRSIKGSTHSIPTYEEQRRQKSSIMGIGENLPIRFLCRRKT
jgi:hypothetical protein